MNARALFLTLIAATLTVEPLAATAPPNDPLPARDASSPHRSLSAIQVDVHAALRAEAVTRRRGQNAAEVVRLIALYREMAAHPQRDKSAMLAKLGLRLRSRLEKVSDHIERKYAQTDRVTKRKEIPSTLARPASNVLAQQVAVQAGGAFGQAAQPGADATVDYGPELVEIIQQTISPATWNINGGNGAIVYFAPRRAIVVSAPADVHAQVDDLLGQLRAAP
jgi:hypothetical protein